MKPKLLGVYVRLWGGEKGLIAAVESLQQEYPDYEVSVLCVPADPITLMLQQIAMSTDSFEIMVVRGAELTPELTRLFSEVPPDCEVVNDTLHRSDLDHELQDRFRSQNRSAVESVKKLVQASA